MIDAMTKSTTAGTAAGAAIGLITPHPMQLIVWGATLLVAVLAIVSWTLKISDQMRRRKEIDDDH